MVMICRIWDAHAATGRYINTDFIMSNTHGSIAHNLLRLKEGSVYLVKNFTIVPNKDEFHVIRFTDFMLEFEGETTTRKVFLKSKGFTRYPFQFVEIDELEPTNNKYLIDVVGYVTNVGRITQTRTGSKTLDFYMANCRGQQIRATMWGGLSEILIEKRTHHVGLYPIVITAMSVKLYNSEDVEDGASSATAVANDASKAPELKTLNKYPAVATPLNPNNQPKEGDVACSSDTSQRKSQNVTTWDHQ
nr:hypothetical protein [Tanacetum cinerariifolium]